MSRTRMKHNVDWLTRFMDLVTVTGRLEIRCALGVPWRVDYASSPAREIPFHAVLRGRAILENPDDGQRRELSGGDIALLPHGSAHVLHDGSGLPPLPVFDREEGIVPVRASSGDGETLDMLCGRFLVVPPHDKLIQAYFPKTLIVSMREGRDAAKTDSYVARLTRLVEVMRSESAEYGLGGPAILDALSSALFALVLRAASESGGTGDGILALAGHPRLLPALMAMFDDPAHPWTLPELAQRCSMSRATFMRHFQSTTGRSAMDLLTDVRMSVAANELRNPSVSVESIAGVAGYQSVSAFRKVFTQWLGVTPGEWRKQALCADAGPLPETGAGAVGGRQA